MDFKSEFAQDINIDPNQLDVECLRQAEVFFKWAERSAAARASSDYAKTNVDVVEAELHMQCRKKPEGFGLGKSTEAAIKAAVTAHQKYKTAEHDYHMKRAESLWLDKAVDAMEQKKRMLEVLITLHGQQYFAGPTAPRNLPREWDRHRKASEDRVNEKAMKFARKRKKK